MNHRFRHGYTLAWLQQSTLGCCRRKSLGPATEPAGNERMAATTSCSVTDNALNVDRSGTAGGGWCWQSSFNVVRVGFSSEQMIRTVARMLPSSSFELTAMKWYTFISTICRMGSYWSVSRSTVLFLSASAMLCLQLDLGGSSSNFSP